VLLLSIATRQKPIRLLSADRDVLFRGNKVLKFILAGVLVEAMALDSSLRLMRDIGFGA